MGLFSPSKPNEPPKPSPEELKRAEKEAKYKQYLIDFEQSKKILTTTLDLKRDYEIIGVIFGTHHIKNSGDKDLEETHYPFEDLKYQAYLIGADAVIGVRCNNGEVYGTAIKYL